MHFLLVTAYPLFFLSLVIYLPFATDCLLPSLCPPLTSSIPGFSLLLVFFFVSFCSVNAHMQRSEDNLGCYPHLTPYLQQLLNWFADVNARPSWPVRDPSLSRSSGVIEIGATNLVYVDAGGSMQVRRLALLSTEPTPF